MVQLYEMYSTTPFASLLAEADMIAYKDIVPFETAQMDDAVIVSIRLAQLPSTLISTGWSYHQLIMSNCKSEEQRLFYIQDVNN